MKVIVFEKARRRPGAFLCGEEMLLWCLDGEILLLSKRLGPLSVKIGLELLLSKRLRPLSVKIGLEF